MPESENLSNQSTYPELHLSGTMNDSPYLNVRKEFSAIYKQNSLKSYKKQIAETRTVLYKKESLKLVSEDDGARAAIRRDFVMKRVTREFWTNFVIRGEETAMLKQLQESLRKEFGADLQFFYPPGETKMIILHNGENGPEPVSVQQHALIVNRAWQLAHNFVAEHTF